MQFAANRSRTPQVDRPLQCYYGDILVFSAFPFGHGLATILDREFLLVEQGDFTRWRYKPDGDHVGTIVEVTVVEG
jgi:hypothetical protein